MKRTLAIVLWALLAASACSGSGDDGMGATDVPRMADAAQQAAPGVNEPCGADSDCMAGQACSSAGGVCVALPPRPQTFSIQVEPAPAAPQVGDQFTNLSVDTSGALDITLAAPVTVQGRVFHAPAGGAWSGSNDAPGTPATEGELTAGRIVAVAPGRVPGTQFRSEASVLGLDASRPDAPRFTLRLLPTLAYQVTFIPGKGDFEALPPFQMSLQVGDDETVDIVLPPRDAYVRLQGVVRRTSGGLPVEVQGAQVACQVGTDQIGTGAVTDDKGLFSLILPPVSGAVEVTVSPGRDSPLFPTRRFRWEDGLDAVKAEYAASPFLTLDVDPVPPVRTVSVQVLTSDGPTAVVPLARVVAAGRAGDGDVTVATTTDATGVASMNLLEGTYALVVVPQVGSPWAASQMALDLAKETGDVFYVRLERRVPISGRIVRESTGEGVGGAVVSLLTNRQDTLANLASTGAGAFEAVFVATTAEDGSFTLLVDSGLYALTVVPTARSGLPRVAYPSMDLSVARTLTVPLPEGALIRGRLSSDGSPLASATVRFFHPLSQADADSTWSLEGTSFASTLQTAAEAVTGTDGRFDVVVPAASDGANGGMEPEPPGGGSKGGVDFGLPAVDVK